MKKTSILLGLVFLAQALFAQDVLTEDVEKKEKVKRADYYVGVQANYLIREVLNLGGGSGLQLNDYLFVAHRTSIKNNWGYRVGVGPSIYSVFNNNGQTKIKTTGHNLDLRVGFDKRFMIDKRWEAGVGLDVIGRHAREKTLSNSESFSSQNYILRNYTVHIGGGPMAYLRFKLSKSILLGTETSFYYFQGVETITAEPHGNGTIEPNSDKDTYQIGAMTLPLSVYLLVKF